MNATQQAVHDNPSPFLELYGGHYYTSLNAQSGMIEIHEISSHKEYDPIDPDVIHKINRTIFICAATAEAAAYCDNLCERFNRSSRESIAAFNRLALNASETDKRTCQRCGNFVQGHCEAQNRCLAKARYTPLDNGDEAAHCENFIKDYTASDLQL